MLGYHGKTNVCCVSWSCDSSKRRDSTTVVAQTSVNIDVLGDVGLHWMLIVLLYIQRFARYRQPFLLARCVALVAQSSILVGLDV